MRTRDPASKRELLLAAGAAVAEQHGFAHMSVNQIVAEAGVAKGSFFHHFGDRAAFLVELHRSFHDQLAAEVDGAVRDLDPGHARLVASTLSYLDGCRTRRAARALLIEARAEPAILAEINARNEAFAAIAAPDFAALGHPHPLAAARLWVVMAAEAAVLESAAGSIRPDLRETLIAFLPVTSPPPAEA